MRIPRPSGRRPKPSPFEPIFTNTEVFHTQRTAAQLIGKGVRTVNKLPLPFESFGSIHFYKETDLRAYIATRAEEDRRARGARQQNRRDVASRTHAKYALWVDSEGVSRALDKHPNEPVCRNAFRRLSKTPELLCPEWRDRARFTYELTEEIGVCPRGHRPDTVVPGEVWDRASVLFVLIKAARNRELDVFEVEERRIEAERQRRATRRSGPFASSE